MKLREYLENTTKTPEIHLIGAIEYDYVFPKSFSHVFCCLSFSSTCWTSRSSSEIHSYVKPVILSYSDFKITVTSSIYDQKNVNRNYFLTYGLC